jgi:hypothetical protein
MTEFNAYDRLIDACRNSSEYPYTLLKKTTSRTILEGYHHHLFENDAALFNSAYTADGSKSPHRLIFWEAWPGTQSTLPHHSPLLGVHVAKQSLTWVQNSKPLKSRMSRG